MVMVGDIGATSAPGGARVEDLYVASYARLVGVLTLAAGSREEAEEVVQEAFVRLLGRWSRISRYDDPEAWVRAVAFRLLSNRFRKARNASAAQPILGPPQPAQGPEPARLDVAAALQTLPLGQRQVVVMHHLLDLDVATVARQLKVPVGTVKSRLARARAALEPLLSEDDHV